MNRNHPTQPAVGAAAVALLVASICRPLPAQTTPSSGSTEEDVTALSPFLVRSSADEIGYYAENTLAGSRLNTKVGDLAASITVVTRQQMLDTGSIDMNDVFLYEANTEGTKSNYTAFSYNSGAFVDTTQASPTTANRIRGMGSADRSHNYYASIAALPFDVYNTETIDINRGPNSLLFGLGSAAGTVNQSSSNADLRKPSAEVGARYGSFDSFRASVRFNQPLIKDRLAVFVAALYNDNGFERKPSHDTSHRQYAALTYAPFRKTKVTASYEHYTGDAQIPNTVTPQDGISDWRAAGSPTWNPTTFAVTRNGVRTVLPNNSLTAQAGLQTGTGSVPTMFMDDNQIKLWMQAALSSTALTGPFPANLPQLAASSTTILKQQGTTLPLFNHIAITDKSLYDWTRINVASGVRTKKAASVFNVELDQQLLPSLFAHAGWYREDYRARLTNYNGNGLIQIDPNEVLLDGTANPFFKQPFFSFNGNQAIQEQFTRNDNYRVSLAYIADLRRTSHKWLEFLGVNRFFGFGERHYVGTLSFLENEVVLDNHT